MLKFFLSVIGFLFLLITACVLLFVWKVRRRMRQLRDAMQDNMNDEAFRRMADKNYYRHYHDDSPHFDDDYFKGDPDGSRKKRQQQQQQKEQQARRTTRTAGGVTIIDDRDPNARKKIFAKDEGEYVDYVES